MLNKKEAHEAMKLCFLQIEQGKDAKEAIEEYFAKIPEVMEWINLGGDYDEFFENGKN